MPPSEIYIKVKSGVSLRRARSILVHTSQYSLLKDRLHRMPPRKDYGVYITRIIAPITMHTHDRLKSIGKTKKIKEGEKGKRAFRPEYDYCYVLLRFPTSVGSEKTLTSGRSPMDPHLM